MTGDQPDMLQRLRALLPTGWFPGIAPILDALQTGIGYALSFVYSLWGYAKLQTRIATATDGWLDMIAWDFFGASLVRAPGQSDDSFRIRIVINLLRGKGTRPAMVQVLKDVTGRSPVIFEPNRPLDSGSMGGTQPVTILGTPVIFRADWQGNQQLYATARTNYSVWSQAFDNGAWTKTQASVLPDIVQAPDGTPTADKLIEDSTNNQHYVSRPTTTVAAGSVATVSVYAMAAERRYLCVGWRNGGLWLGGAPSATFDLVAGTVNLQGTGASAAIQAMGSGWYRCMVTATAGASPVPSTGAFVQLLATGGTLGTSYLGDGASGAYVWGVQTEYAPSATAYVATTSNPVTVTDYQLTLSGLVTLAVPPLASAQLTWSGSYQTAAGDVKSFTAGLFGVGNGVATIFNIGLRSQPNPAGFCGVARMGSMAVPYTAMITAFRPVATGGGAGAAYCRAPARSALNTPLASSYTNSSTYTRSSASDADIYAAVDAVKPVGTVMWVQIR